MDEKTSTTFASKAMPRRNQTFCLAVYLGTILFLFIFGTKADARDDGAYQPFRLALSASTFSGVNETDLLATMKVWIMTVAKEHDLLVDPHITIHPNGAALADFSRTHAVDGMGLSIPELADLRREFHFDRLAVGIIGGHLGNDYLLLVHRDGGIQRLDQLKGSTINVWDSPRMSLARIWLDTVLLEENLGTTSQFFSSVKLDKKISKVVLPVFFKKCVACLVTRAGFSVMAELNPQLKQQLRVLSVSPPLIAGGFAFRTDTATTFRPQFFDAIDRLEKSQAGRQILTLTQADAIKVYPISILDDSLALIAKHRRLCGKTAAAHPMGETK